jgi:two-component system, NarL family, sensor histidine kinase UhpB
MLPVGITAVSFLIDLETPDDIADGFFYIYAVVSCTWVPRVRAALYTVLGSMLPMILGSFVWLHEGLAQELAAVGWALDGLARDPVDEAKVRSAAAELRLVVDSALRIVHRKAVALREPELELGGLPALVERYAADFTRSTGLPANVLGSETLDLIPPSYAILCLKVVQEALTNVAKHANASHVRIECCKDPEALQITIADDGRGIDPAARVKPDSLGLLGLTERLIAVGGAFTVSNVEGGGVRVEARIPTL